MKTTLAVLAVSILMAPQAEARSLERILKECGIGAAIFKNTPAAAAISNIIWDLGTTATLSDITGKCNYTKNVKVAMFVSSSYDKLETEVVTGNGQYLETLSELSGKKISDIRASFTKVVSGKEYSKMSEVQKADKLYNIVTK